MDEASRIAAARAKLLVERIGVEPGRRPPMDTLVEIWVGISTDEEKRAGGYRMHFIPAKDVRTHPGLEVAYRRNQALAAEAKDATP